MCGVADTSKNFRQLTCAIALRRYLYRAKGGTKKMKATTLIRTVLLVCAFVGTGLAPTARAAHATNFLDALHADVTNRLANVDSNTPAAEERALNAAARILNRNSRTLQADLGLLAQTATALDTAFSADAQFSAEQQAALGAYSAEAQLQFNTTVALAGTNEFPRPMSNQLARAQEALDRGNDGSNSVPVRARAIAFALNKIRVAEMLAHRLFKAPASLDQTITLNARGGGGSVTLDSNHTYTIPGDPSDETGAWSYERTSSSTATVTLNPIGGSPRTIDLKFSNSSRGSFSGTTAEGDPFKGQFTISSD